MAKLPKSSKRKSSAYRVKSAEGNRTGRIRAGDSGDVAFQVRRLVKQVKEAQPKKA